MTLHSIDPATGDVVGTVQVATKSEVAQAVASAHEAQAAWAAADREATITRFRRTLYDERDDVARLITRESGKPLVEAFMADILTTLETAKHLAGHARSILAPRRIRLGNPLVFDRRSHLERSPLGVVAIIAPWNYPLSIAATGILTALAAGNTVVFKPSEKTPTVGQWLVEALWRCGVPADALHVVHGAGEVGAALVAGDVDGVLFTGSVATGQRVASACAPRFRPAVLELGGKDPMVVLPSARTDLAVAGAVFAAFTNAGQTCAAVERLYVPEARRADHVSGVTDAAAALRVGNGLDPGTDMGPVIDDSAAKRILKQVRSAEKDGATVVTGGEVIDRLGSRFIAPTVLTDVTHDMAVMQEETFGPVLPVAGYATENEAVHLANDSPFGLTASVWGSKKEARRVASRLEAATVTINDHLYTYAVPETPWGGWKDSGVGVTHGSWGVEAVTRWRHINEAPAGRARSPWYYPYDDAFDGFLRNGMSYLHGKGSERARGLRVPKDWMKRR